MAFKIPDWLNKEDWQDFVKMRQMKKRPMTDRAKKRAINVLERLKIEGEDPNLVLQYSTDRGYDGLFPVPDWYKRQRGIAVVKKNGNDNLGNF